ncbi:MAG: hypothetical protein K2X66_14280 [Cyanobacteria bacterium]|nr:hypothetical protein [Cyanobacteriota bacterium]
MIQSQAKPSLLNQNQSSALNTSLKAPLNLKDSNPIKFGATQDDDLYTHRTETPDHETLWTTDYSLTSPESPSSEQTKTGIIKRVLQLSALIGGIYGLGHVAAHSITTNPHGTSSVVLYPDDMMKVCGPGNFVTLPPYSTLNIPISREADESTQQISARTKDGVEIKMDLGVSFFFSECLSDTELLMMLNPKEIRAKSEESPLDYRIPAAQLLFKQRVLPNLINDVRVLTSLKNGGNKEEVLKFVTLGIVNGYKENGIAVSPIRTRFNNNGLKIASSQLTLSASE